MITHELNGHRIEVSSPGRVYFPESGTTKEELVDYYRKIAPVMLPHLRDRPIAMQRFPRGVDGESFFQKRFPKSFPRWIEHADVVNTLGENVQFVVVQDAASLVYLANQGCITLHAFLATRDDIRKPDRMTLDLDPSGTVTFDDVIFAAHQTRDALEARGLSTYLMVTGSKGLHVVVPIEPGPDVDDVRAFARTIAEELVEAHPDRLTIEQRKANRGDRIFLDYMRNGFAQTAVAAYSVRALPGAPVATPIDWEELGGRGIDPQKWNIKNVCRRLGQREDPWRGIEKNQRPLPIGGP